MIEIVGGGLAAVKVVEGYREAGGAEPVRIWSLDEHGPYHRPGLSKRVLRGEAEPESVLAHPSDWYGENDVDLRLGAWVDSLDELEGETIVLATGARPRELPGTLPLRTLDNAVALRERALDERRAVVVGGGFIGCEVAASLATLGVEVTQIVREPHVFAVLEAPQLSEVIEARFRDHGVDLRLGATEIPDAPLVVAGIGVQPNVELAQDAGLEVRSGVVTTERFETSRAGTYAVGDVAEFYDPVFRRHRRIEHWSNAAYHGQTLGHILGGLDERYDKVSSFFSEQFGETFKLFGDTTGYDEQALEGDFGDGPAVLRYRRGGRTVAALTVGQDEHAEAALQDEIRAGAASSL